ncbi:MAG: hypothetical protein RLZZ293_1384 [Pseudomonadota bacterium]|jgi:glycyl-tRNA synthetase beta chain
MSYNSLIIEFLSEELPPINLENNIGLAFAEAIYQQLSGFLTSESTLEHFITPRRFGCIIKGIDYQQKSQMIARKGPAIAHALKEGIATPALLGFAKSCATTWENLEQRSDGYFYFNSMVAGKNLDMVIEDAITQALKKIHIAKAMRWGNFEHQFVRPLHNLVVMFNQQVIECNILGLQSNAVTSGHRFMAKQPIQLDHAESYLETMLQQGKVVANFARRRDLIQQQLTQQANQLGLKIQPIDGLLNEVTALVEWPEVLLGCFEERFLQVPQECLILSMAKNQKYFALLDQNNKLTNKFLFVSNLKSTNPQVIVEGNQKVLTARLADAEFFYQFDLRTPFNQFINKLTNVVYHNQLGTQAQRIKRLANIASQIAPLLGVDNQLAAHCATLLKADLVTEMVGEFPELQGVIGNYYALASGESPQVAQAIEQHYYPRFSGDNLPQTNLAVVMALSDKLEALVGMWGIGLIPSGDKDPYALRRAALGIIRILLTHKLDLTTLLNLTLNSFTEVNLAPATTSQVAQFIYQRLANYLTSVENYSAKVVSAVLSAPVLELTEIINIAEAFSNWVTHQANTNLFEANKRIENILKKNTHELDLSNGINPQLFNSYESELYTKAHQIDSGLAINDYLVALSTLAQPLTEFFANVMVMDENLVIRSNRLNLLAFLASKFNHYGKLAELA